MHSADAQTFDEAYYQRFYYDRRTRVVDPAHSARLGQFVASYLAYLRVPVHRVPGDRPIDEVQQDILNRLDM